MTPTMGAVAAITIVLALATPSMAKHPRSGGAGDVPPEAAAHTELERTIARALDATLEGRVDDPETREALEGLARRAGASMVQDRLRADERDTDGSPRHPDAARR